LRSCQPQNGALAFHPRKILHVPIHFPRLLLCHREELALLLSIDAFAEESDDNASEGVRRDVLTGPMIAVSQHEKTATGFHFDVRAFVGTRLAVIIPHMGARDYFGGAVFAGYFDAGG
jgi:hypothetical protein